MVVSGRRRLRRGVVAQFAVPTVLHREFCVVCGMSIRHCLRLADFHVSCPVVTRFVFCLCDRVRRRYAHVRCGGACVVRCVVVLWKAAYCMASRL